MVYFIIGPVNQLDWRVNCEAFVRVAGQNLKQLLKIGVHSLHFFSHL